MKIIKKKGTINVNKIGLACVDDKRYVLDNNVDTLAHGHYKIKQLNNNWMISKGIEVI